MNKLKPSRVLVLAPHTDDGEFGCGGSIARFIEEKVEVFSASFSSCAQSVPSKFPADILVSEVKAANSVLGVKKENLFLFDYDVRTFNYKRQEILDEMIRLRNDIKPDLVFMPSVNDVHQDHHTIALEGVRAFKFSSIFSYEIPWNNLTFNTSAFIHLEEQHLRKKVEALSKYKSQAHRNYASEEFIRSLALARGIQIGTRYAETFDVVRWVIN